MDEVALETSPEPSHATHSPAPLPAAPDHGPRPDDIERGRLLLAGECRFFWGAASPGQLPPPSAPEVAFTGRSNVGKSSLLNALTNRKNLARTSHAPGRTRELNFFVLNGKDEAERLHLVDMPGYGYAAAAKTRIAAWTALTRDYLRGRASLLRVFVLVDGRHGVKDIDLDMLELLDRAAVSYQIVLTKRDEVRVADQAGRIDAVLDLVARRAAAFPEVIFTSSRSGAGLAELRATIARLVTERCGRRHETT